MMKQKNVTCVLLMCVVGSGVSSMSKAKSQTFDPFADLGNLGSTLTGKSQLHMVMLYS